MAERGGARVATRRPRALWFEATPQRLAIRQHSRVEALPQRPQARFSDLLKDLRSTSRERGCRASESPPRARAITCGAEAAMRSAPHPGYSPCRRPCRSRTWWPPHLTRSPELSSGTLGALNFGCCWVRTFLLEILQRGVVDGEELRRSGVLANVGLHTSIDTRPRGLHSRSGLSRRHGSAEAPPRWLLHTSETDRKTEARVEDF